MKTILVTGAAQGLGKEIATRLGKEGFHIALHYRNSKKQAEETARLIKNVTLVQGDFSTLQTTEHFLSTYQQKISSTYAVIHNVGNYLIAPITQTTASEWLSLFQTNLFAQVAINNALLDDLIKEKGQILSLGTVGLNAPRAAHKAPAYQASKTALWQAMLSYAKALAPHQVRVNMLSPGFLETAIDLSEASPLPFKRAGSIKEFAELVAYLLSDRCAYITGQNIEVAGGFGL